MRTGVLGEFTTPEAMIAAIVGLRDRGYRRLDAFSPYPVHGAEEAAGMQRSPLDWIVFPFALVGAGVVSFVPKPRAVLAKQIALGFSLLTFALTVAMATPAKPSSRPSTPPPSR